MHEGSVLVPLLFLICINDFLKYCQSLDKIITGDASLFSKIFHSKASQQFSSQFHTVYIQQMKQS